MTMKLSVRVSFRASHSVKINNKREDHHTHRFQVELTIEGEPTPDIIVDFLEVDRIAKEKIVSLFHQKNLNDFMENPTAENIAKKIFQLVEPELSDKNYKLVAVKVWESPRYSVEYHP